jgi:hypothetical protein
MPVQTIKTRVVGVTFENRQEEIKKIEVGETVLLIREPSNRFDKNAIKVVRLNHNDIGYIKKEMAIILAPRMDNPHKQIEAKVINCSREDAFAPFHVMIQFDVPELFEDTKEIPC